MGLKIPWSERAESVDLWIGMDVSVPKLGRRYCAALNLSHKFSICVNIAVGLFAGSIALAVFANSFATTLDLAFLALDMFVLGLLGFIITYPLAHMAFYRGIREIKGELLSKRCQLCVHCFYDLSARPREIDTCPECGTIAPRRECVRLWCKLLRSRF
ncbi:MAG: hypothetical protein JKX70_06290 [Phycisphaerales bacterium]|nr:hypothetical protein [Phycisphaerales bacterium]